LIQSYTDGSFKASFDAAIVSDSNHVIKCWPSNKGYCETLLILSSVKNLTQKDIEEISIKCLMLANNSLAKQIDSNLYEKCLNKLIDQNKMTINNNNLTCNDLIDKQISIIFEQATNGKTLNEVNLFKF
jgi:hypothetical protein